MAKAHTALDAGLAKSPPIPLRILVGLHLGAMLSCGAGKLITADWRIKEAAQVIGLEIVGI